MKNITLFIFVLSLTISPLHSKEKVNPRIAELFEVLSYDKTDFDPTGTVCEKVAELELLPNYPATDYKILPSMKYQNKIEVIGELDLVVLDLRTNRVETIYEVKCWKSYKNGLRKVREQKQRFVKQLNYDIKIFDQDNISYSKDVFSEIRDFKSISQQGGVEQGFDIELSLGLKDLMKLRSLLLDCHAVKKCPRIK